MGTNDRHSLGMTRNYARFYLLLKRMPGAEKEELVAQFTGGRTTHLREMVISEYNAMCREMERVSGVDAQWKEQHDALRKARSGALRQLQLYGVHTASWDAVDTFCLNPRICGKVFRYLTIEELNALNRKMRAINRKALKVGSHDIAVGETEINNQLKQE